MGRFDPVSWDVIETVRDPPAAAVLRYVERLQGEVSDETPFGAVKTIYDAWKTDLGEDRTTPDQGAAFVIAYSLERDGIIAFDEAGDGWSLTDRRPGSERLEGLFWERKRTSWWIAVRVGVHWALVQYWLYEDDIPLMERNITPELMERIRAHREEERA